MTLTLFITSSGFCSRRKASLLIKEGKVEVNGKVIIEPWFRVPDGAGVRVAGKILKSEKKAYIVFNKPKGVTATLQDRFAEKKIVDFIPRSIGRIYPAGRLDKSSRGLIILTNDGDFCYRLTHPKFEVEKEYLILINGKFNESYIKKLKKGIEDDGELLKVKSAVAEKIGLDKFRIRAVVCEGKKRHLRRLFESLGLTVEDLQRIRIGSLELGDLREGSFKSMTKDKIYALALKNRVP